MLNNPMAANDSEASTSAPSEGSKVKRKIQVKFETKHPDSVKNISLQSLIRVPVFAEQMCKGPKGREYPYKSSEKYITGVMVC